MSESVSAASEESPRDLGISIFGLGYVGAVTAACLAERGFPVWGVDVSADKVERIRRGESPIVEAGLNELIGQVVQRKRLHATTDLAMAIAHSQISLICVGTPSKPNGDLELDFVARVAEQIGRALAQKSDRHTVVVRSTVLPGTTESIVQPILEKYSGKSAGKDFGLCFNPEFLREGSSLRDFHSPPFTLVGTTSPQDAQTLRLLYGWLECEFIVSDIRTAEMVKYINNGYHAVKVAFANEVGRLCAALAIDSHRVMDIFCKDTKQNLSSYYLRPGYAFGGSCLPKDLRAILHKAKSLDVSLELLAATLQSNRTQMELGVSLVERAGNKRIGLLGLSFKAGTDDLRESPLVHLVETLLGRGYDIAIYDANVSLSQLVGSNKAYIEQQLPHISQLMRPAMQDVIEHADTIVIGNPDPRFAQVVTDAPADKIVIDLVRILSDLRQAPRGYQGIGW